MTMSEYRHTRSEYARQLANLESSHRKGMISDGDFKVRYRTLAINYLLHTRADQDVDVDVFIIQKGMDELKLTKEEPVEEKKKAKH